MVNGIDKFKEYFRDFPDQYSFIGGVACDLLMNSAGLDFRATKDLDVVLIIEALTADFVQRFWQFVSDAGYELKEKSNGEKQFYRFSKPSDSEFPYMIELFARKPDTLIIPEDVHLAPIHVSDECSSLSAILLNDDYYNILLEGRETVDELSLLKTEYMILFKIKAYLDLSERKQNGEHIDSKHIKKHKNDVFRLSMLLTGNENVKVGPSIHKDFTDFIEYMQEDTVDLKSLGINELRKDDILNMLTKIYNV